MNLDTCALLLEVSIECWTARKLDKQATQEVVANKHAGSRDAARVNKSLFAGRSELKELESFAAGVRNFVKTKSLPWNNNGTQLLPTIQFLEFDKQIKTFEQEFYDKVQEFLAIYPTLIAAQAFALDSMFKRDDYPSVDDLQRKFFFRVTYSPVPAAGDFRVDVGMQAQAELEERLNKVTEQRVGAMKELLVSQMGEQLKRMSYILGGVYKTRSNKGEEIEKSRNIYPSLLLRVFTNNQN